MVAVSAAEVRDWLIAVGTVVAALGTLAAVVVALVLANRAERTARRRRPSLTLSFDPTNGIGVNNHHIVVAHGRDYADVAPLSGIFTGGKALDMFVEVEITRLR